MARGRVGISMRRDMFVVAVVVRLCGGFVGGRFAWMF